MRLRRLTLGWKVRFMLERAAYRGEEMDAFRLLPAGNQRKGWCFAKKTSGLPDG